MTRLPCDLAGRCGGCPAHARSLEQQRSDKRARLVALGVDASLVGAATLETPAALAFREHLDLRWDGERLGLIDVEPARGVVDMARCPLVVPALGAWLEEVRRQPLPIARASLRLRVGGDRRGVWIDCAHADVKLLLDRREPLVALASGAVVELGPKARRVALEDGVPRLVQPELAAWSRTFVGPEERPVSLYMSVRAFSQPGGGPNRALVRAVRSAVGALGPTLVLELGAGAGNLTLPLVADRFRVRAVELEGAALERSAREAGLMEGLEIHAASFERAEDIASLARGVDAIVADPPRQGLGRFLDGLGRLSPGLRPEGMIYVSCHPEALASDSTRLAALGYRMVALGGVDQFPWTDHCEWIASFRQVR